MSSRKNITADEARKVVSYNPETGVFVWLQSRGRAKAGKVAGHIKPDGYLNICVLGKAIMGHRLAWLMHYGEFPNGSIDHINRDRSDNRISNLRHATESQNSWNIGITKSNSSGYKGVSWHTQKQRWQATIKVSGSKLHLGYFTNPETAARAYNNAAKEVAGDFAYLNEV